MLSYLDFTQKAIAKTVFFSVQPKKKVYYINISLILTSENNTYD